MAAEKAPITIIAQGTHFKHRSDGSFIVNDVRLSYEHVFKKWKKNEGDKEKYSGTFILPLSTHRDAIAYIKKHAKEFALENLKSEVGSDKYFLRNGNDTGKDEYKGAWVIKASEDTAPTVINRDKSPVKEEDDIVYSGCYVNVMFRPWAQNNTHGKRVNANLLVVQFNRKGDKFSSVEKPDVDEAFEDTSGGVDGAESDDGLGDDGLGGLD